MGLKLCLDQVGYVYTLLDTSINMRVRLFNLGLPRFPSKSQMLSQKLKCCCCNLIFRR